MTAARSDNHNFPIEIKDFRHFPTIGCGAYS
jgi:hypothetical protein